MSKTPLINRNVRFPVPLYERLVALAEEEGRSTNAQIVRLVEEELARRNGKKK